MNLNEIIERKKEEWEREFNMGWSVRLSQRAQRFFKQFLDKAIRESVEEAFREVRPYRAFTDLEELHEYSYVNDFDNRVKEFMK